MPTNPQHIPKHAAPHAPDMVRFRQAGATVLLSTDISAAAEHARATLYAYAVDPGPDAHWSITVTLDPQAADWKHSAEVRPCPVEIGSGLSARHHKSDQADVFRVEDHRTTITLDQARHTIDVRCADPDAAVHFTARLVRQAMTAQLLAAGAAYAHTAAVSVGGRGVLISGHRHRGKTTTLTAVLRHLPADFVTNDRLLITAEEGNLRGHAWPAHMRAGVGTLLAYPDLKDLVPAQYRSLGRADLWKLKSKVSVEPADFPRLIHDGTVTGSCPVDIMIWPDIAPQHQGVTTNVVEPDEVRERLLTTRLFMVDPASGVSSHINHWLVAAPPADQQAATLAGIADAIARSVPCYRVRAGGDPAILARAVAELVP
ncbi:MAG: hypothetical protein JO362_02355 [Streptomycetaceae bacterium]|nr:hypothetical protein [Streptomycetaceae bacterium]